MRVRQRERKEREVVSREREERERDGMRDYCVILRTRTRIGVTISGVARIT